MNLGKSKLTLCQELDIIEKKEQEDALKKYGIKILKTLRRKLFSRVEWIAKRQQEIETL